MDGNDGFLFVEQIAVGKLTSQGEDIAVEGTRLLSLTKPVGLELYRSLMSARMHLRDIEALNELFSERRLPFEYFTAAKGSQNDNASSVYAWQTSRRYVPPACVAFGTCYEPRRNRDQSSAINRRNPGEDSRHR